MLHYHGFLVESVPDPFCQNTLPRKTAPVKLRTFELGCKESWDVDAAALFSEVGQLPKRARTSARLCGDSTLVSDILFVAWPFLHM